MKKHEERLKVIITDEQGDGVEGVGGGKIEALI